MSQRSKSAARVEAGRFLVKWRALCCVELCRDRLVDVWPVASDVNNSNGRFVFTRSKCGFGQRLQVRAKRIEHDAEEKEGSDAAHRVRQDARLEPAHELNA